MYLSWCWISAKGTFPGSQYNNYGSCGQLLNKKMSKLKNANINLKTFQKAKTIFV